MSTQDANLLGTWKSDPRDSAGTNEYGDVTLKFSADGTLLYIVHESDRDQIMRLTYRTDEGFVITDQPSQPRPERTQYRINEDGILILAFGGQESRYLKID